MSEPKKFRVLSAAVRPRTRVLPLGLTRRPDSSSVLPPLAPRLYALRMDAELDFASASTLERNISGHLARHPGIRHVCLFAQPINRIDVTGVEAFRSIHQLLRSQGVTLHISGMKLPVEAVLRRSGDLAEGPSLHLYRTDVEALAALQTIHPETTP